MSSLSPPTFTIWTLSARFRLRVKSCDSRAFSAADQLARWRQPAEAKGHAGDDPDEPELCASLAPAGNWRIPCGPRRHFAGRSRSTGAVARRTCPKRASQYRPARDRVSRAGLRRRFVCRRHRNHAGATRACAPRDWKPGRATRSRGCATKSSAPTRSSCPNRRSWWIGRRAPTSRRSTAILAPSAYRLRTACSPSAAGSMPAKRAPWSVPSMPCARAAKPSR